MVRQAYASAVSAKAWVCVALFDAHDGRQRPSLMPPACMKVLHSWCYPDAQTCCCVDRFRGRAGLESGIVSLSRTLRCRMHMLLMVSLLVLGGLVLLLGCLVLLVVCSGINDPSDDTPQPGAGRVSHSSDQR